MRSSGLFVLRALLVLGLACGHGRDAAAPATPAAPAPAAAPAPTSASSAARAARVVLFAGGGSGVTGVPATAAKLDEPFGVTRDRAGNFFVVEMGGNRIKKIDRAGVLTVFAGTGARGEGGDGGPATMAVLNGPHHLDVLPGSDDIWVADTWNNRVRRIDARAGVIAPAAGSGKKGFGGDGGPAAAAAFGGVYCLAFDTRGERMVLADLDNRRVRAVDLKTGVVTTIAGNGERGVPEDGADALTSPLSDPRAVAVGAEGQVYVLERGGHALRVVGRDGKIRTVAGTGQKGLSGDGGDARVATMNGPKHLTVDHDGSVLIVDTENHVIRRYQPRDGRIVRVAGTGRRGAGGVGGPPEAVELARPHGVYVDPQGAIYISDSENHRVLKLER